VLALCLYWPAHDAAYHLDDLAWISLPNTLRAGRGLFWVFFSPQAWGTVRPLGDRLWFLLASHWYGLNPLPIHALALVAQIANFALAADVGARILEDRRAAAVAVVLWAASDILVTPLVWASALNEEMYTLWFLLAFAAFLRWEASGRAAWLWAHAAALVLALATLELSVTLPAVLAAYAFLLGRREWKRVAPSAAIVAAYCVAHYFAAPLPSSAAYKPGISWNAAGAFWRYWSTALGPSEYARTHAVSAALALAGSVALSAAIVLWIVAAARRGRMAPLFCFFWFALTLAPALLTPQHVMDYYLFLPSLGLAWLAGGALFSAPGRVGKSLAATACLLYVCCQLPATVAVRDWTLDRLRGVVTREASLAEAVREIRHSQPRGPVFLTGLDGDQFWWGICYGQLERLGFTDLHVMPDAAAQGVPIPPAEWCRERDFQFPAGKTERLLREGGGGLWDVSRLPPERRR
jgi:hypothetical protein